MSRTYYCTIHVRGYEMDSFKHVNHAVYIQYMEHARWKMLEEEKITFEQLETWKRWPVISRIEADYLRPTVLGDKLEVRTKIVDHGKTNFTFEQVIYHRDKPVFKGIVKAVMINEKGRPASIPDEIERLWSDQDHGAAI